jgi:cytochrome c
MNYKSRFNSKPSSGSTALPFIVLALLSLHDLSTAMRPGDQQPIKGIHPGYILENIRPADMNFPIGGMDFLSDGSLVVSSWKDPYGVFILKNTTGPKGGITVTEFASGLTETLGLKVVHDSIYILQKDELTLLLDSDNDGKADEFRAITYDWSKSTMEKEYATGLAYDGTYFYGAFGDPTISSGTAVNPAPAGRQNGVLRFSKNGKSEPFSGGLRVPGGVEYALGEVWLTENQGGYRPSNPLMTIRQGRWYGRPITPSSVFQPIPYRALPDDGLHKPIQSPFAVDLPFKEAGGRSPGNPLFIKDGLFKGQMFVPDADGGYGGICRVFLEKVKDEWQGATFHFSRGFEGVAVYRIVWGPDGALYAGANGSDNAGWTRTTHTGLDRLKPSGKSAFEMLAVRSLGAGSFEIEFTKPLATSLGSDITTHLQASKWWDRPQETYGGGRKLDSAGMVVTTAKVSADRMKVTVVMSGIEEGWEYYFHWLNDILATDAGEKLWGTEAWYTLNHFGPGQDGSVVAVGHESFNALAPKDPTGGFSIVHGGKDLLVQSTFASGTIFQSEIIDLQGRIWVAKQGIGRRPLGFSNQELPTGTFIIRLKSKDQSFAKLVTR